MNFSHGDMVDRLAGRSTWMPVKWQFPPENILGNLPGLDPDSLEELAAVPEEEMREVWLHHAQNKARAAVTGSIVPSRGGNQFHITDIPKSYPKVDREDGDEINDWVREVSASSFKPQQCPLLTGRYRIRFGIVSLPHLFPSHASTTNALLEIISRQQISLFLWANQRLNIHMRDTLDQICYLLLM
jgi:hypothetical protein